MGKNIGMTAEKRRTYNQPVASANSSRALRTARLWVYYGDWRNPYTVYDYTTSRMRDGPAEFRQDFDGYLHAGASWPLQISHLLDAV